MKHYFTSDWHLFGKGFLRNPLRKHFSSVEEMNEHILTNLFETTKPGDNLYFLGDIGWGFPENYLNDLFIKIKKHKLNFFWIEGNHDSSIKVNISSIIWKGQIKDIVIDKQPITLCHYPMIVWNKSHYDAWQLFGHIHYEDNTYIKLWDMTPKNAITKSKRLNVNTEMYNFKPLEFEEIRYILNETNLYRNFDLIEKGE